MNQPTSLRPLLLAALAAPTFACIDPTVVGGEGGADPGETTVITVGVSTTTTSVSVGTGQGAAGLATAALGADVDVATFDRVCPSPNQCSLEDDVLYLFIDSQGSTCSLPLDPDTTVTAWEVVLGVPPWAQEVGLHALDTSFFAGGSRSEFAPSAGVMTVGATGGMDFQGQGTLEIFQIDESVVRFAVTGVEGPNAGEIIVAARCGSSQLTPEGIAAPGDLVAAAGTGGGGSGVEPDGLTFVVGDTMATCGDALAASCSGDAWQLAVYLPADYLVPGRYAMADPRIGVSHCAAVASDPGGVIEVLDVEDDQVIVRFEDVTAHADALEQDVRLARCP